MVQPRVCLLGTSLIKANKELTYDAIVARSKNSLHIIFCILGNFGGGAKGRLKPHKIVLVAAKGQAFCCFFLHYFTWCSLGRES